MSRTPRTRSSRWSSLLAARHDVVAVGIGAAGWVANDNATVLFSPHLAWRDQPLRAELAERINLPLVVENDANAAAWAEHRFGIAAGEPVVVMVTLGTGIGGGLIVDGVVFRGAYGIACEYGHMTVVQDGRQCACGNRGCWEMYASGRALARDARSLAADSPMAAARMMELAGGSADAARRPDRERGSGGGRPGGLVDLHRDGPLARPRAGQPGRGDRPVDVRHRRGRIGGRRPAAASRARGVPAHPDRPRVPAVGADRAGGARAGRRPDRGGRPGQAGDTAKSAIRSM